MKRFLFPLVVHVVWLGSAFAQTPDAAYIKEAFGTLENFQAVTGAVKVTACLLKTPPRGPEPRVSPTFYKITDYIPGPEKELSAEFATQLRGVLSDGPTMYDPEAEEPAGGTGPMFLRYTFQSPDRKVCLYLSESMYYMGTWVDDKQAAGLWVNDPGKLKLRSIAQSLFSAQPPEYIKKLFGTPETFQAVVAAGKVSACMLKTPPKKPGVRTGYLITDYIPGPEKELPAHLVLKLRDVLSDAEAMYDAEEEEPAGLPDPMVLRYTFHAPNRPIYLYFNARMAAMNTWVDGKPSGGVWVNRPALLPLRATAKKLFPTEPSL